MAKMGWLVGIWGVGVLTGAVFQPAQAWAKALTVPANAASTLKSQAASILALNREVDHLTARVSHLEAEQRIQQLALSQITAQMRALQQIIANQGATLAQLESAFHTLTRHP